MTHGEHIETCSKKGRGIAPVQEEPRTVAPSPTDDGLAIPSYLLRPAL
jgi:hypothetical protein